MGAAALLPGFEVVRSGRAEFVNLAHPSAEDRALAREGLQRAAEALRRGEHRLVILDELNVAAACGLVGVDEVLAALAERGAGVDVVLTGRDAPQEFVSRADLVTFMTEIKHPYRGGVAAREGIEY